MTLLNRHQMKQSGPTQQCLLGAHFSIAKGLHDALFTAKSYGCPTLQIFTKNAHTWKEKNLSSAEIDLFEQAKIETGIKEIASHTSYLINLASPEKKKHTMSCSALKQEIIRSSKLGIPYVVLHPGSLMGSLEQEGIRRIAENINSIFAAIPSKTSRLLFETTAGQGSGVGHTFEQLAAIIDRIEAKDRIGVCIDTCHMFAAGYDIRNNRSYRKTIRALDSIIGLQHLYLIHLNDSKKGVDSRVDRHEHIGHGAIGLKAFELFMNDKRFRNIPKIIETPKGKGDDAWDQVNLELLRGLIRV